MVNRRRLRQKHLEWKKTPPTIKAMIRVKKKNVPGENNALFFTLNWNKILEKTWWQSGHFWFFQFRFYSSMIPVIIFFKVYAQFIQIYDFYDEKVFWKKCGILCSNTAMPLELHQISLILIRFYWYLFVDIYYWLY